MHGVTIKKITNGIWYIFSLCLTVKMCIVIQIYKMFSLHFRVFLIYFPKCPSFSTIKSYAPNVIFQVSSLNLNSISLPKMKFLFFNSPLITPIRLAWFVIMLSKELKHSTFSGCVICHNLYWGWLTSNSQHLSFCTFISIP